MIFSKTINIRYQNHKKKRKLFSNFFFFSFWKIANTNTHDNTDDYRSKVRFYVGASVTVGVGFFPLLSRGFLFSKYKTTKSFKFNKTNGFVQVCAAHSCVYSTIYVVQELLTIKSTNLSRFS
jgi:hypothetical protein